MNILFVTFQGDIAGSTNSISYLSKGLARRGHNIYVGCRKESLLFKILEGSKVHRIPMLFKSKFDLQNIKHIRDIVKKYDIQIINAQSSWDRYNTIFAKWMYKLPVKLVHTRRQRPQSIGGFLQNWLYVKGTNKIIAVSNGVKASLTEKKIPPKHIKVIYNGTPKEKYQAIDQEIVESLQLQYSIQSNDFVIGCVSRKKQQEQILQALQLLPFKVKMIFVGIDKKPEYQNLLQKIEGKHDVFFTGVIPNKETLNYFPLFTIKILASTIEGLSQSILESMALGVPVIATDFAGNPELIKDSVNGLLFENNNIKQLAECIIKLHDQPNLRKKLAEAGRLTALNDFSINKTIANYESFFEELISVN